MSSTAVVRDFRQKWITERRLERIGGEISVESQEGQGAKFTVTVPKYVQITVCA